VCRLVLLTFVVSGDLAFSPQGGEKTTLPWEEIDIYNEEIPLR
jgi:hypothetical protein